METCVVCGEVGRVFEMRYVIVNVEVRINDIRSSVVFEGWSHKKHGNTEVKRYAMEAANRPMGKA